MNKLIRYNPDFVPRWYQLRMGWYDALNGHIHLCGESMDDWLGVPQPTTPRCSGRSAGDPHRERYMEYRVRIDGFRCMKCRREITWQENLNGPHNAWWRGRREQQRQRLEAGHATS